MVKTRREIALAASRKSAEQARRRRFERYAAEMEDAPADLSPDAQRNVVAALQAHGWVVTYLPDGWR